MSKDDKKDKDFREELLDGFPKDLIEDPVLPDFDPMTVDIWDLVNIHGLMPKVMSGIQDPELRQQMMEYTRGLCEAYQLSLDKAREHLKDPETFKEVVAILAKNRPIKSG